MITAAVIDPLILLRLRILMDVSNAMECTQGFLIPITHMILCHICHHMPFGVLVFDLIYMLNVIGSNKRCIVKYVRFLPFWLQQEMRPVPTCLKLPIFIFLFSEIQAAPSELSEHSLSTLSGSLKYCILYSITYRV